MKRYLAGFMAAVPIAAMLVAGQPALAQKSGGIVRISHFDSPASMSLHEEATAADAPACDAAAT